MDEDSVEGTAHQARGAVKEALGKLTGVARTEAEGIAERTVGKAQNTIGRAEDDVRDAVQD